MKSLHLKSISEQVADNITENILSGDLTGELPGVKSLAAKLGINHKTVEVAAKMLEEKGLLVSQGSGKPRRIVVPKKTAGPKLKIGFLLYEPDDRRVHFIVDLRHSLDEAGHTCVISHKTLTELDMNPRRVSRFVKDNPANAWIVQSGSSEVLKWFSKQPFPTFALFGNLGSVSLARTAPATGPAIVDALRKLISLGHKRIVMLAHKERRLPSPGFSEQLFLDELENQGISTSNYNLPDWNDTPKGLCELLNSLFRVTPPTALIIGDVLLHFPVQTYLNRMGIFAPESVSLVCVDVDPRFKWCSPAISHIRWEHRPLINRVINWAGNVACGKEDIQNTVYKADFVIGETIGPAPDKK